MAPKFACLALLLAGHAVAAEYAVLASGTSLRVERHETEGATVRLFLDGGSIELPAAQIARFEQDDRVPAPPPSPATKASLALSARDLVEDAARRYGLPPAFVHSVASAESGYSPAAVSPKGAIGVMQLMPGTARLLGADPQNPAQNIDAGTRYLRDLLQKYDGSTFKALAAYNAGPGAVEKYHGLPPYRETLQYIERVVRQYNARQQRPAD